MRIRYSFNIGLVRRRLRYCRVVTVESRDARFFFGGRTGGVGGFLFIYLVLVLYWGVINN